MNEINDIVYTLLEIYLDYSQQAVILEKEIDIFVLKKTFKLNLLNFNQNINEIYKIIYDT